MPITVKTKITGVRNKEKFIKPILKERRKKVLEKVKVDEDILILTFSETEGRKGKNFVKQYSKTKYPDCNSCVLKFLQNKMSYEDNMKWRIVEILEFPDEWVIFFRKN